MIPTICLAAIAAVATAVAFQTPNGETPVFRSGSRLVQIEVVVRDKKGAVKGLDKEAFQLFDEGKPERIAVFSSSRIGDKTRAGPLPTGAVSNRTDGSGEALPNATVVLFDLINTRFDLKAYEGKQMLNLVHHIGPKQHLAIYVLGRNLHVVQEFTDDPTKLLAAIARLDPGRDLVPPADVTEVEAVDTGLSGPSPDEVFAAMEAQVSTEDHNRITLQALTRITKHLSGMPGRRNLIWLKDKPILPPAAMRMLQQADIHLYPVLVRTVESGTMFQGPPAPGRPMKMSPAPDIMNTQRLWRELAASTGGMSFNDARDVQIALETATEDSRNSYVIGYYPSDEALDGKYHRLTVKVAGEKANHFEVRYPSGYLASKDQVSIAPPERTLIKELLQNPLDSTSIGLTARVEPSTRAGIYQLQIALDVHDIHLERKGNRSAASVELAFPVRDSLSVNTLHIDLSDEQLAEALNTGFRVIISDIEFSGATIRVFVRDPSTGLAGSLRIPVRH